MFKLIKKHFLLIILALIVACFTFGPQVVAIYKMGGGFHGVYPINTADDVYYLARAQEIADGHTFLANPYLYEHKDGLPMQFWLPDYLLAKPLTWLNIPMPLGFIFYDFFFSIILVILTYTVFYLLTKNKYLSLSGTSFLHLALFLSDFARSPSPQLNFIFCLVLFVLLIQYIRKKKNVYLILASISFGLLFHIYTYYWTFFVVSIILYLFFYFLFYKKINWPFIFMSSGAFILAIPYFLSSIVAMKLPSYSESIYRLGMIDTHFPSGLKIVLLFIVSVISFLFLYKKNIIKLNELNIFLFSNIFSAAICVNQHIITGKNLEFSSHYLMITVFSFIFLIVYLLNKCLQKNIFNFSKKSFFISLFIFVVLFAVFKQKNIILNDARANEQEVYWQNYQDIFSWLNNNTAKESVVYANNDLSQLIPIYTSNNVFYARPANFHFLSEKEIYDRFIINNYFEELTEDFISKNMRFIWGAHYINNYNHLISQNKFRKIFGLKQRKLELMPDLVYSNFLLYREELLKKDFESLINKYKTDYIIWDKNLNPSWRILELEFVYPVYTTKNNDIIIFKIQNES